MFNMNLNSLNESDNISFLEVLTESEKDELLTEGIIIPTSKGKEKVSTNAALIEKGITNGLIMCEKFVPLTEEFLKTITKAKLDDRQEITDKYKKDSLALDYDRGSNDELKKVGAAYVKLRKNKFFNAADYKSKDIKPQIIELVKKCSKDGEFGVKAASLVKTYGTLLDKLNDAFDKAEAPLKRHIDAAGVEFNWFSKELNLYIGDANYVKFNHKKVLGESVNVNFDTSVLEYAITESYNEVEFMVNGYSKVINSITESASEADLNTLVEASNESVKDKIINILKMIKDFVVKKVNEISAALMSFVKMNSTVMNKIYESVKYRIGHGDYKKGPYKKMFKYHLDEVNLSDPHKLITAALSSSKIDFNKDPKDYKDPAKRAELDGDLSKFSIKDLYFIKHRIIREACPFYGRLVNEFTDYATMDRAVYLSLRGLPPITTSGGIGGLSPQKFDVKFDIESINIANSGADIKTYVVGSFNRMIGVIEDVKTEAERTLQTDIGFVVDEKGKQKKDHGVIYKFYNKKIMIVNTLIHILTTLNMAKLKAAMEHVNAYKTLAIMAYTYPSEVKDMPKQYQGNEREFYQSTGQQLLTQG